MLVVLAVGATLCSNLVFQKVFLNHISSDDGSDISASSGVMIYHLGESE